MMKKLMFFSFMAIFGTLFLQSCAVSTKVQKDASVDFKQFKTFAWNDNHNVDSTSVLDNEIVKSNLQHEVNKALIDKGLRFNPVNPDIVLDYSLAMEKVTKRSNNSYYSTPYFSAIPLGRRWVNVYTPSYYMGSNPTTYVQKEGLLNLKMYRAKDQKLIWKASVEGDVNSNVLTNKNLHQYVRAALRKVDL